MFLGPIAPIGRREVKTGDVASGAVELVKTSLLEDLAIAGEGDDVVAVR